MGKYYAYPFCTLIVMIKLIEFFVQFFLGRMQECFLMYTGHLCGPTIHVASGQAWLSPRSTLYMYIFHVLYWICVYISWSSDDLQRFRKTIVFLYVSCLWPHTQPISPNQCMLWLLNTLRPMDAISQTTFANAFSSMKMQELRLRFHWCLFLRFELTIFQHWFR